MKKYIAFGLALILSCATYAQDKIKAKPNAIYFFIISFFYPVNKPILLLPSVRQE